MVDEDKEDAGASQPKRAVLAQALLTAVLDIRHGFGCHRQRGYNHMPVSGSVSLPPRMLTGDEMGTNTVHTLASDPVGWISKYQR